MPYNGTGTFVLTYNWNNDAAAGILVRSDRMQNQEQDMADGLSTAITKDGQTVITANIPMAGYKFTGLGNGASGQDSVTYAQVFASPTFTGTVTVSAITVSGGVASMSGASSVTVPTATVGDNSTKAASTAFVNTVAMAAALPSQTGNGGKFVFTDGSAAAWQTLLVSPEIWMGI